jgi:hypothetical protein
MRLAVVHGPPVDRERAITSDSFVGLDLDDPRRPLDDTSHSTEAAPPLDLPALRT